MEGVQAERPASRTDKLAIGAHVVDPRANTITGPDGARSVEPKIMDVLLELCDRQGEVVSREELIDAVWGVQHGADESLTRAISLLRKALEAGPKGRRAIETFSKRGYRLNLDVRPDTGVTGQSAARIAAARPGLIQNLGIQRLGVAAAVAVAAVAGIWAWYGSGGRAAEAGSTLAQASPAGAGRFAIAPWQSRSGLADISETGSRALASAFAQRGIPSVLQVDARENAGPVGAEFRASGEVRRRGENTVVAIAFTDFETGAVIWADEQTRPGADGTSLVEGAVAHAANVAECALSARGQYTGAMGSDVLAEWMRHCNNVWSEDPSRSFDTAERLVALSPDEAPAQAALAKSAATLAHASTMENNDASVWAQRADDAANRTLELDPGNVDALFVLASFEPFGSWEVVQRAFESLNSGNAVSRGSDEALSYFLLRTAGYLGEALTHASFRAARAPAPEHLSEEAWLMATAGMRGRALAQLDETIRLYPDYNGTYWRRFNVLALHGDDAEAELALAQTRDGLYPGKDADFPCWERYLLARFGRIEADGALTDQVCADNMPEFRARLHGALGQVDLALEYSRRGIDESEERGHRAGTIHFFYPEMAEMRTTPDFWRQADRVGLVDFWISYGRWPDFCSDRRVVVDCPAMAEAVIAARAG